MTKRECAIIMAYTGAIMLSGNDFDIFHAYIEEKLGRPVFIHELASSAMEYKIKEASKEDFIELCRTSTK